MARTHTHRSGLGPALRRRYSDRDLTKSRFCRPALRCWVCDRLGNGDRVSSHNCCHMLNAIPFVTRRLPVFRSPMSWSRRSVVRVLPVSLASWIGLATYGQSAAQQSAENLVRMHEAWGLKASTPNASLVLRESMRSGQVIKFTLTVAGVPKGNVYTLVSWPVTQKGPSEILRGVTLDASGLAICAGTPGTCSANKPNDPIDVNLRPIPGEPVRLGLVSADGATKVFATVVPIPLRGEDRGCSVEATLLTPGAELVLIEGLGFTPNNDITMDSESEGERHTANGKADPDGRYTIAILPYKQGIARGTTKVQLKSAKCAPSVNVLWGQRN